MQYKVIPYTKDNNCIVYHYLGRYMQQFTLEEKNEGLFDYDQNDSRETCAKQKKVMKNLLSFFIKINASLREGYSLIKK